MVEIEFYDEGKVIKGILLGKYQRPHDELYSYEKKFLWKTKTINKHRTLNTRLYIVFIPWKHRIKELREVDEKYILNPTSVYEDERWIKKDRLISETYDGYIYPSSLKVNDFAGYEFLCDNNSFIADLCLHQLDDCLKVLYKNMPELLTVDLDNIE